VLKSEGEITIVMLGCFEVLNVNRISLFRGSLMRVSDYA